jgi:CRP/FNR family transcriptional regulator, cyclic AMP receptor protein
MPGLFNYDDPSAACFRDQPAILSDLTDAEWDVLIGYMERKLFPAGTRILKAGDKARTLYLVVSGEVDVLMDSPKGPVRILTVTEGSTFGETGFFDGEPRPAHAIARGAVEVLALCPERLEQLVAWHPRLAHKLVMELGRVLSVRLRKLSKHWAIALAGRLP